MRASRWTLLLGLAAATAVATSLLAVREHAVCTAAGYRLAAAQREAVYLRRDLAYAEQRVAELRAPHNVLARAHRWGLGLVYPPNWNVVSAAELQRRRAASRDSVAGGGAAPRALTPAPRTGPGSERP